MINKCREVPVRKETTLSTMKPAHGWVEVGRVALKNKDGINPVTGCKCTFAQKMVGDGCDICNKESK